MYLTTDVFCDDEIQSPKKMHQSPGPAQFTESEIFGRHFYDLERPVVRKKNPFPVAQFSLRKRIIFIYSFFFCASPHIKNVEVFVSGVAMVPKAVRSKKQTLPDLDGIISICLTMSPPPPSEGAPVFCQFPLLSFPACQSFASRCQFNCPFRIGRLFFLQTAFHS